MPLPSKTPLVVKLLAPVPPLATMSEPTPPMIEAGRVGMSLAARLVPDVTRPLLSVVTLV